VHVAQPGDLSPGPDERLLGCVLRPIRVAENEASEGVQASRGRGPGRRAGIVVAEHHPLNLGDGGHPPPAQRVTATSGRPQGSSLVTRTDGTGRTLERDVLAIGRPYRSVIADD